MSPPPASRSGSTDWFKCLRNLYSALKPRPITRKETSMNTNTNLSKRSCLQLNERRAARTGALPCLVAWVFLILIPAQVANAQGTVFFNNNLVGALRTHVFAPCTTNSTLSVIGNGTPTSIDFPSDMPSGTVDWSGFPRMGTGGVGGQT